MKKTDKIKYCGIWMTREFYALNHPSAGKYKFDYADWHLLNESKRLDINFEQMIFIICSCINSKIRYQDIQDIIRRKYLVDVQFHTSKKLNGDFNIVIDSAEKAYVL